MREVPILITGIFEGVFLATTNLNREFRRGFLFIKSEQTVSVHGLEQGRQQT